MLLQIRPQDNLTRRARKILNELEPAEARRLGFRYPQTDHVVQAMLRAEHSHLANEFVASTIFRHLKVHTRILAKRVESRLLGYSVSNESFPAPQSMVPQIKRAAAEEARRLGEGYVGSEHLLVACLSDRHSVAVKTLAEVGFTHDSTAKLLKNRLGAIHRITLNNYYSNDR
ncbi:MAG: hypothetical protein OHK0011_12080 [Turneriella sp.]